MATQHLWTILGLLVTVSINLIALAYLAGKYSSRLDRVEKKSEAHDSEGTTFSRLLAQSVRQMQDSLAQFAARENTNTAMLHEIKEAVAVIKSEQMRIHECVKALPCVNGQQRCDPPRVQT